MKRIFTSILLLMTLSLGALKVHAADLDINAPSYILIDPDTGLVLAEKSPDEKMYPASTTKIMTAIIALEQGDLNQVMTASEKAVALESGAMHIGIMPGEQIKLEDLINALLIRSANDTANIIAENIGPTYEDFIGQMNKKAQELGATNTHFVNPHGMHDNSHYTTVRDMAKIAAYAMKNEKFREIVKKPYYDMSPTNKHEKWDRLYTINRFLTNLQEYKSEYFTAIGIKPGYTSQAGNTLVSAGVNDDGMELIAVVFGVVSSNNSSDIYECSKELLEYGFINFSRQKLIGSGQIVKNIHVEEAAENPSLNLLSESEVSAVLPNDQDLSFPEINIVLNSANFSAPISKGEVLGYMEFKKDGVVLGKTNLVASRSIEEDSSGKTAEASETVEETSEKNGAGKFFTSLAIALGAFILLRISLRRISRIVHSRKRKYKS